MKTSPPRTNPWIITVTELAALSPFEAATFRSNDGVVTNDPEGTPAPHPTAKPEHETLLIFEDAAGKRTLDVEHDAEVIEKKFLSFFEARALPAGVAKVQVISSKHGRLYAAHPFFEGGPVKFFDLRFGNTRKM